MHSYVVYLVIFAAYIVLFLVSRGGFRAAAAYLVRRVRPLREWTGQKALFEALLIFFVMNLIGLLVTVSGIQKDTASRGYLLRNEFGGASEERHLEAAVEAPNGKTETAKVEVTVDPRKLTKKEIEKWMEEAAAELPAQVLSGQDPGFVTQPLQLVTSLRDDSVEVSWISEDPKLLETDGTLGASLPKDGAAVMLHAHLVFLPDERVTRDVDLALRVYPPELAGSGTLQQELLQLLRMQSEREPTSAKLQLPKKLHGKAVRWSEVRGNDGIRLLFLGALMAVCLIYREADEARQAKERRNASLLLDYPQIVSKFVLYLGAGMSARSALGRMAAEYEAPPKKGSRRHDGCREICTVVQDMKHGLTEREAYARLGQRCSVPEYKALANILLENSMKGGRELLELLEREAEEAVELRRKNARRLGEEAGTKILLPMMVMLMIVMVILMIPAVLNFQF